MLKLFIGFFVFCLVLFIYLHINFHFKTSDDLEVYEVDQVSKEKLEEICDLRQPVMFDFNDERLVSNTNMEFLENNYHAFEMKIRNVNDTDYENDIYLPLPLHSAVKLFKDDKTSSFYSESNNDLLQETGAIKTFQYNDEFLRPFMVSNCNYDVMCGSQTTQTPFRYELNYRNYFLVTAGSIKIKMATPKSTKYLYTVYDYDNFEFRSPVNPWNPQAQYSADFDKIKCLEVQLSAGKIIQIPAYWWYSIQFEKGASVSCLRYRTYMNNVAISPYICLHALQLQNVKRDITKKKEIVITDNSKNPDDPEKKPKEPMSQERKDQINQQKSFDATIIPKKDVDMRLGMDTKLEKDNMESDILSANMNEGVSGVMPMSSETIQLGSSL